MRVSRPELSRLEALTVLALPANADDEAVKRAYRRLARELHPDAGGDVEAFRDVQLAYERLIELPAGTREQRPAQRARPSRRTRAGDAPSRLWSDQATDVAGIDWDGRVAGTGLVALDVDVVARSLVRPAAGPVHPFTARSRGPSSLLNRWLHLLADDLTATLQIRPARTRGRRGHDVEVWVRVWARGARRRVDAATLPDDWVRQRGSSSTTLIRTITPSPDRRITAARAARIVDHGLATAGWPLTSWYAPADEVV
ncbi:MAG: J domain-containing protein [Actinobacteria bacterium]|nr:J domain-containing protein [Actinomycetota bacterium]